MLYLKIINSFIMNLKISHSFVFFLFIFLFICESFLYAEFGDQINIIIKKPNDAEIEILGSNKPTYPNTPKVPEYIIKDKNNKFVMAIGGYIRPIFGFDIGNDLNNILFIPNKIPVPAKKGNKFAYTASALYSALDFQIIALPYTNDQLTAYIKLMYIGSGSTAMVTDLYIIYRNFLLGRGNTLLYDGESIPVTIDPQGPNGAAAVTAYRLSYVSKEYNGFSFAIGLELPTFDRYTGTYQGKDYPDLNGMQFYEEASNPIPDIPAYIQYKGSGLNRIRVSGIFRNFFYRNRIENKTHSVMGWGAQVSGNLQPFDKLLIYFQATYGHGIANYIADLNGKPLSYIPRDNKPGRMEACPMFGYLGGLRYSFTDKLQCNVKFSQARVWDSGTYYPNYKYGLYSAANMFYFITPYLQYGIEYLWGRHQQFNNEGANANRIQSDRKSVV